jgi:hypothetical protein
LPKWAFNDLLIRWIFIDGYDTRLRNMKRPQSFLEEALCSFVSVKWVGSKKGVIPKENKRVNDQVI